MATSNDGNMIPNVVTSPSNVNNIIVPTAEDMINTTLTGSTIIQTRLKSGTYVPTSGSIGKAVSASIDTLVSNGDLEVLDGTPGSVLAETQD